MSHIYFATRGRNKIVKRFIEDIEDIFFPYKLPNADGTLQQGAMVQAIPRPIQLWELVIPEESEEDMLKLLGEDSPSNKGMQLLGKGIRKFLKLQPIPKKNLSNKQQLPRGMVAVHLIGIKKDKRSSLGQEML